MTREESVAQAEYDIVHLKKALVFEENRFEHARTDFLQKRKEYKKRIKYLEDVVSGKKIR